MQPNLVCNSDQPSAYLSGFTACMNVCVAHACRAGRNKYLYLKKPRTLLRESPAMFHDADRLVYPMDSHYNCLTVTLTLRSNRLISNKFSG